MGIFHDVHCLEDFGMIAGSYRTIHIDCTDTKGDPIRLSTMIAFGCKFFWYGTNDVAFEIEGVPNALLPYRMEIRIPSALTEGLADCCLEYMPYVTSAEQTIKYGKGRIMIEGG
ncbi:MAG: hypothetical protein J6S14_17205 [Clostridia bacterium]|nr:hypothetical protein [Clostridia bacterium]